MSASTVPSATSSFIVKGKPKEQLELQKVKVPFPRSSGRHDFAMILGISGLIVAIILIATAFLMIYTIPSFTGQCRKMILGFEQGGFYTSQEQLKTAISYCYGVQLVIPKLKGMKLVFGMILPNVSPLSLQ